MSLKTVTTTVPATQERQAHLRDYWRVAWQGRWMVLAIFVVVLTLTAVGTFVQTPIYRATARVEIQPRAKSITPNADFSQLGTTSWSWMAEDRYINTQMEILRSRDIAQAVLMELGLEEAPGFADRQDPAGALASRIKLEMLLDTYVLEISIEDKDPQMAQLLANAVARVYIRRNVESAVSNARQVIDELFTQMEPIKASIAEKESRRIELARQNELYVPEARESSMEARLKQLQEELTQIQIQRGSTEAIFNAIEEIERQGDSYQKLPQVANDLLIVDLSKQAYNLEKELEKLSLSYLERHPKVVTARTELEDIRRKIDTETGKIIAKIKTEYAIDKRREEDLQNQIRRVRAEGLDISQASGQIGILDAEIKEDRRIYDLILARIKEIDLNQETLINNVRLLDEAVLPAHPVRPRKALNLAAGAVLGLFLGLGTVFFVDYLDNTIKSSDDIEQYLNLPLLAVVPKMRKDTSTAVKEAFQTLRTSVLFSSKGRSLKSLLITSAGPGEGKTSTVLNLARALASAGDRVVLVDADLRRPTIHSRLDISRAGGLTNYLMEKDGGRAWLRYLKDAPNSDNLKVITCGPIPPNPVELFGAEKFHQLLAELRENFDWVLIDSPPLASLSDSLVLASLVDMAVLVIKHNENDRDLIRRSAQQIRKVNANLVGAVLNDVDLKRAAYKDYYYTGYYYYARREEGGEKVEGDAELAKQEQG